MKNAASSSLSLSSLIDYQSRNGQSAVASANYHLDEINRLRAKYATLVDCYHKVQMVETEGLLTVSISSLSASATVALDVDLFTFLVEPILSQMRALEGQILAMLEDLPSVRHNEGWMPSAETNAISALCLPQPQAKAPSAALCPFLPDATPLVRTKRPVAATA